MITLNAEHPMGRAAWLDASYNAFRDVVMKLPFKFSGLILLVFLSRAAVLQSQEITVGWHDGMYLLPGDGVKLNRQDEPLFPGLIIMNPNGSTTGNTGNSVTTAAYAQNTYRMLRSLNANASVSLKMGIYSGNVNFSFFGRQSFDRNDLKFVVTTTRNFGTTKFAPLNFSSNFWKQVAFYRGKYQGPQLYSALTDAFGTHFVAGYQSSALVSVVYSFHYASAAAKQRASLDAGGGAGSLASFETHVSTFFGETNTARSMSYEFYSTDPFLIPTNFGFASAGTITNIQQFSIFSSAVLNYANAMTQTNAKITGYVLDPLWFAPGMLPLLGGYVPPQTQAPNYDNFLAAYSALQAWKESVDPWILDGESLSWLNSAGRQMVQQSWFAARRYLADMKTAATDHFTTGVPLNMPPEVTAFLANLSYVTLPKIYSMDNFIVGSTRYVIGRVDCGCRDLTIPIPFNYVSQLYYQTNFGRLGAVYYDSRAFSNAQLAAFPTGTGLTTVRGHLTNLFASPQWACLTSPTTNPNLNGFFLVSQPSSEQARWSLAIIGDDDANGDAITIDRVGFLDSTSGSCPGTCTVSVTNVLGGL